LNVRIGIATGLVVVGDLIGAGAAQERGGETPNLAARRQALARPDTLVISEATRRQIGGLFDLADLGPLQLAGFTEAQRAWRVLRESGAVSRFEALRSGETPLVGREEEIELLLRHWRQAKSAEGRVVLISGEPGIASRGSRRRFLSGSEASRTRACAISARRITRRARSIPLSRSSNAPPGSPVTTRSTTSSASCGHCSLRACEMTTISRC
jgi:hypothetical protein